MAEGDLEGMNFAGRQAITQLLNGLSVEQCSVICSRAGLRIFGSLAELKSDDFERMALKSLRSLLIASSYGYEKDEKLKELALGVGQSTVKAALEFHGSSHAAAMAAGGSASSIASDDRVGSSLSFHTQAGAYAIEAAIHACNREKPSDTNHRMSAIDALKTDLAAVRKLGTTDFSSQSFGMLWPIKTVPNIVIDNHRKLLERLNQHPDWFFFRNWYLTMWEGTFDSWNIAHAVAQIDDNVWEEGLAAVAGQIEIIADRLITEKIPQAEVLFENEDGLYDVRSSISDPAKLTQSVLSRTQFAFDMAITSNSCDLNEMSIAAKVLRHTLDNCSHDPNAIEQFFRNASSLIKEKIGDGQFSDDDTLTLLVNTLDEAALQMRADHPEVASASETRLKQTLREIDEAKRLEIAESMEDMLVGTAARLSAEYQLGADITRQNTSPDAQASAIKMGGERAAKISIAERAKQAESSGAMSGVKIGLRAQKLVELVIGLFSGGG